MRKGSDLIGKQVISYDTGEILARVKDLIFDQASHALAGVLVGEGNWLTGSWVVEVQNILSMGADALIVPDDRAVVRSRKRKPIQDILKADLVLRGTKIMTTTGTHLGTLVDLYFDDQTRSVVGYEVSGGLFADVYSGRSFVPAPKTLKIGRSFAFVPPEVADLMAEQVGGLKGSMLLASERLQQGSGLVARRLQEITALVTQRLQETAASTNQRIQTVIHQAVSAVMNSIVDPQEQRAFILGRTVDQDILLPDGAVLIQSGQPVTAEIVAQAEEAALLDRLYVAVGGSVAEELTHRIQEATQAAHQRLQEIMDQAVTAMMNSIVDPQEQRAFMVGKTVDADILLPDGRLFLAQGAEVTEALAEQAEAEQILDALYQGVGGSLAQDLSRRVQAATAQGNVRIQEVVNQAVSNMMNILVDPAQQKAFMLGKTVDREVVAPDGTRIIGQGETVTVQVAAQAEAHALLDQLFKAVGGSFAAELNQRIQATSTSTSQRLQTLVEQAVQAMTQGVVSPEDQKVFMIGKTVEYDLVAADGTVLITAGNPVTEQVIAAAEDQALLDQLYRAVGGSFVAELSQKARQILAKRLVSQTKGRRIRQEIRTGDGFIIAATGQIVTPAVIEKAQELGKEQALVEATGLSAQEVFQTSGNALLSGLAETSDRLRQGTQQVGSSAGDLWASVQHKSAQLSQHSQQWWETQRINRALGRPTTRVILDQSDRVILDVGELITHDAIQRARQSGVLGILLGSVYVKQPPLTVEDQRARIPSLAALPTPAGSA
ncbi:PRC-barrel domain-containing protein [Lyngbya confervoides]|uniref:PRC-barrel domain-containing protein n=1 Tax=Lyngbya confervoides BDU141951 TaxID=1574623 RepID=A0ABD4SZI5_9CYAN|nr:PRC-barrel domain-containing protein [Lyngbya confervoides]MCM1981566.1 PRC-barrel domain-containing protein [Lyngbya confervoides BDU141951]